MCGERASAFCKTYDLGALAHAVEAAPRDKPAPVASKQVAAYSWAANYPSSKLVIPNTRSNRIGRIGPVYIRGFEHRSKTVRARERNGFSVGLRHVKEDLASAHGGDQRAEHCSAPARSSATSGPILNPTRHGRITPQAGKAPVATEREADMAGRADPCSQKRRARSRKHRRIRFGQYCKRNGRKRHHVGCAWGAYRSTVAHVPICQHESRFPIVLLLGEHAIEPDRAGARMCDARLPQTPSIAPAPKVGPHDVESRRRNDHHN